jgi:hypothetical protein
MRVSLVLPKTNAQPDLEQTVFDFTNRLGRYCASIESCEIAIEPAQPAGFVVNVALHVFGKDLRLVARDSASRSEEALSRALEDALRQASAQLEPISEDHSGCGCGLETERCAVPRGKAS